MRPGRRYDALEHHGERLAPVDRRFSEPFEDRVNLVPDGLPFRTFPGQVEIGQHAFEPVDHFGMALKPGIGAALVKEGLDFVHRYQRSFRCLTMAGNSTRRRARGDRPSTRPPSRGRLSLAPYPHGVLLPNDWPRSGGFFSWVR
jgi:hypothetical protein